MNMKTKWANIEHHFRMLLDNEVRVINDDDIESARAIAFEPDHGHAAKQIGVWLDHKRLGGDLRHAFAQLFTDLLGVPVSP